MTIQDDPNKSALAIAFELLCPILGKVKKLEPHQEHNPNKVCGELSGVLEYDPNKDTLYYRSKLGKDERFQAISQPNHYSSRVMETLKELAGISLEFDHGKENAHIKVIDLTKLRQAMQHYNSHSHSRW